MARLKRWWWWIWTGDSDESATRRRIEEDARRFSGLVLWGEPVDALQEVVSAIRYALEHTDPRLRFVEPQIDRDTARQLVDATANVMPVHGRSRPRA